MWIISYCLLNLPVQLSSNGRFCSYVLDSSVHHHHFNTKWEYVVEEWPSHRPWRVFESKPKSTEAALHVRLNRNHCWHTHSRESGAEWWWWAENRAEISNEPTVWRDWRKLRDNTEKKVKISHGLYKRNGQNRAGITNRFSEKCFWNSFIALLHGDPTQNQFIQKWANEHNEKVLKPETATLAQLLKMLTNVILHSF